MHTQSLRNRNAAKSPPSTILALTQRCFMRYRTTFGEYGMSTVAFFGIRKRISSTCLTSWYPNGNFALSRLRLRLLSWRETHAKNTSSAASGLFCSIAVFICFKSLV